MIFTASKDISHLDLVHFAFSTRSSDVENVLNTFFTYKSIEIRGIIYYDEDWTQEIANKFWENLSKTVTHIKIYDFQEVFSTKEQEKLTIKRFLSQLRGLQSISCYWTYLNFFLTDTFLTNNETLETVHTHKEYFTDSTIKHEFMITDFYPHKGRNYGDFYISEEIVKLLTHCKSLKSIGIPCHFVTPDIMCALNETASFINTALLGLEKVIFVGDAFPKDVDKYCKVTGIRIIIDREEKIITFSTVSMELGPEQEITKPNQDHGCHEEELIDDERNFINDKCFFLHHPVINEQIKNLTIKENMINGCPECWQNLLKSYPKLRNISSKTFLSNETLKCISKYLKFIKTLSFKFAGSLQDWPPIPSLSSLSIELYCKSSNLEKDKCVSQNCPGLTSLRVCLGSKKAISIAYREFVQSLGEKWKEIRELTVDEMIRMSAQDLQAIQHCLEDLRMLDIGCNEGEFRILQLFLHLQRLELIIYRNANGTKKILTKTLLHKKLLERQAFQHKTSVHTRHSTNEHISQKYELPTEVWAEILTKLSYKDRLVCRVVSKKWLSILSHYREFRNDRILTLQNCVMDLYVEPMETFSQSTFPYEILRLGGNIEIDGYKELPDFLSKLGKEIKEIQVLKKANVFELVDLFKNGLTVQNLPKLQTLLVEKSITFTNLIQECETFKELIEKRITHLRFDTLKLAEIAAWPMLSNITSFKMNILYSFDNSFLCHSWPMLKKVSIGFIDGQFNGRLLLLNALPMLKDISCLEIGLYILDTKILDVITNYSNSCRKLEVLCISATNIKKLNLEKEARNVFKNLEILKEISFGETSIKDQVVEMKGFMTFRRSIFRSLEIEKEDGSQNPFFGNKIDIKVLKVEDTTNL